MKKFAAYSCGLLDCVIIAVMCNPHLLGAGHDSCMTFENACSLRTSAYNTLEVSRLCAILNYVDTDIDIVELR